MKILYCDCYSGISGDMFLAAMLDAGYPLEDLEKVFSLIELPEYQKVSFRKVQKRAVSAGQVTFVLREDPHHHTGDLIHGHSHRSFADIRKLITGSNLPESIVAKSLRIFEKIAQAESSVHNVPVDEVHFHEVGATDSILDIVGAAAALDYFGIDQIFSSPLPLGNGEVMTQHGLLPIPAPATAWLLRDMHAKIKPSSVAKELVTPTGAGILAAFAEFDQPEMTLTHYGTGAGSADFPHPNILRVFIGDSETESESCIELSTNLDDMTPEQLGSVLNRILEAGALDAFFTPIQMKKNRPAVQLSVIANRADEDKISELILRQTTTLGVRVHAVRRHKADRKIVTLETEFGPVRAKTKMMDGETLSVHPEYDECERISAQTGLPLLEVQRRILKHV